MGSWLQAACFHAGFLHPLSRDGPRRPRGERRRRRDRGPRRLTLRTGVLPYMQVITKPGFVCFTASSIFLIQKAAWVIKYLEDRKMKEGTKLIEIFSHVGTSKYNKLKIKDTTSRRHF